MKHIIEVGKVFKTNSYGDIRIVERLEKGHFLVEFVDTGYRTTAHRGNIVAGKVRDYDKQSKVTTVWEDCNIPMVNNAGDHFTVVQKRSNRCVVLFRDTNYMTYAEWGNVVAGKITDPYKKTFLGVGYTGEYKVTPYWKKARQLWSNMMKRCYNPNDERGYFGRCFVDVRWHCFANFLEDLPNLYNFDKWVDYNGSGVKYNLDKDLKLPGNNVYSPISCSFEEEGLNKGATSRNNYYR